MKKLYVFLIFMLKFSWASSLEGFYKVPNFLYFKGAYVYVLEYDHKLFAYGVANLDGSPDKLDSCNPDENLRTRTDKGVVFLRLDVKGNELKDGLSYNFQNCSLYYTKGQILENGNLELVFSMDKYFIMSKALVWEKLDSTQIDALNLKTIPKEEIFKQIK